MMYMSCRGMQVELINIKLIKTHMKAGWVNDPQVALMTLKLWNSELTRVHDDSIKTLPHRVKARNSFYS